MSIKNIEGLSVSQIRELVNQGAKFVVFPYTISFVVMTLKRGSAIFFVRPGENTIKYSYPFIIVNFLLGWWGLPWGPVYTLGAMYRHITGGKDLTQEVLSELIQHDPEADTTTYNINGMYNGGAEYAEAETVDSNQSTYNIPR
ncbi:hypothetical protein [Flavobacterium sp.]|uniref:hypothetical protein n=1 Tax=Flavobacterium sp. TaxID=239 RepID=UPI003D0E78A0